MHDSIVFDESPLPAAADIPIPTPQHRGLTYYLLKANVVHSPGDAAIIMAIFAGLLVAASIYLLAAAIPEPPQLGADMLRSGEVVPSYVR